MVWDPENELNDAQAAQIEAFASLLAEANAKVNLVSRASQDVIRTHHIPHCLCLGLREFSPGSRVVDWGMGGGLPSIPLAIRFPEVEFVGVDSRGKKVIAVRSMARELGLYNLDVIHVRAESWSGNADYAVSRGTASLKKLWSWSKRVLKPDARFELAEDTPSPPQGVWPWGLVVLKGGDLREEIQAAVAADAPLPLPSEDLEKLTGRADLREKYILALSLTAGSGIRALHAKSEP